MNKEIKEILRIAKECHYIDISFEESDLLLDYITNLQQENERIEKECVNKINQLGELSSRIYKAIEYINKDRTSDTIRFPLIIYKKDLLNILQNGSDDNE